MDGTSVRSEQASMWRGIDLSGTCVVLGAGTGRLVQLLVEQVQLSGGNLVVVSDRAQAIQALKPLASGDRTLFVQASYRQLPFAAESVDLLVVNGMLREVPTPRLLTFFEEIWQVLVPGGQLRVSDIIEATEADYERAWAQKNALVQSLAQALSRSAATSVDLVSAARALKQVGFEGLAASFFPGYLLTDAWLEETVQAIRNMASRIANASLRDRLLGAELDRLVAAYRSGDQRASQRFALRGAKVGGLALDMEASFTEEDLMSDD